MYYRVNDKIVENYNGYKDTAPATCGNNPMWITITLIVLLVLILIFLIYSVLRRK